MWQWGGMGQFEKIMINLLNFILIFLLFIWFRKKNHILLKYLILNLQKDKYVKYVIGKFMSYYDDWVEIWGKDKAIRKYIQSLLLQWSTGSGGRLGFPSLNPFFAQLLWIRVKFISPIENCGIKRWGPPQGKTSQVCLVTCWNNSRLK